MRKILHDLRDVDRLITLKRAQPVIVGVKKPHRSPGTLVSTNCRISEDYAALTFLSIVLLVAKRLRASDRSRGSRAPLGADRQVRGFRSEEHTSELQSLMRISYSVFSLN